MPEKKESHISTKYISGKTEETARAVDRVISEKRKAAFQRFPLLFTLLGAFGFVATFYGFERLMDQLGLSDNPIILLAFGIAILVFTGTLYRRLGN